MGEDWGPRLSLWWREYGSLDSVWRCVYLALISFPPLGILPQRYNLCLRITALGIRDEFLHILF